MSATFANRGNCGRGFLEFSAEAVGRAEALQSAARGEHLFFEKSSAPRPVVVDFSSQNWPSRCMSAISARRYWAIRRPRAHLLGHKVITDNHIGDWGTQFEMLIAGWKIEKFDWKKIRRSARSNRRTRSYVQTGNAGDKRRSSRPGVHKRTNLEGADI